jgi:hypothetical protein
MEIIRTIENINNKFYKENYYYLYLMSIYHLLVIGFMLLIPDIPVEVFYKLTFTPQATNDIISMISTGSLNSITWTLLLLSAILILDLIFLYIIIDEFAPKFITMKNFAYIEGSILILSFLFPYLRDVFIYLSINTLIITCFYKIIKYEKAFTGIGFMKYIMITVCYIYIIKLTSYPIILFIRGVYT